MRNKRNLLIVGLMILIIIGPLAFAWGLIQKGHRHQFRLNHHGDLITSLPNIAHTDFYQHSGQKKPGKDFLGKWWLLYVGPEHGNVNCETTMTNLRQIHIALGKHATQLKRAFLADPYNPTPTACTQFLEQQMPELPRFSLTKNDFHTLFTPVSNPTDRETTGELYLIDPQGNIMMRYTTQTPPKDVLSDVKRLLRISKQG